MWPHHTFIFLTPLFTFFKVTPTCILLSNSKIRNETYLGVGVFFNSMHFWDTQWDHWLAHPCSLGEILIFAGGKSSFLLGAKNEDKTMLCVVPPPRSCSAPAAELVAVPSGPQLGAGVALSWQQTPWGSAYMNVWELTAQSRCLVLCGDIPRSEMCCFAKWVFTITLKLVFKIVLLI